MDRGRWCRDHSGEPAVQARARGCVFLVFLVTNPQGIAALRKLPVVAAMDEKIHEKGYILPGRGNAGEQVIGTR